MKITKNQHREIEFLIKHFEIEECTQEQKEEYIAVSVHGKNSNGPVIGIGGSGSKNPLLLAKTNLDRTIKMWREDLTTGLLGAEELKEDFNCEYGDKLVDSIIKSVTPEYRKKVFSKSKAASILAFTNFPEIMKHMEKNPLGTKQ